MRRHDGDLRLAPEPPMYRPPQRTPAEDRSRPAAPLDLTALSPAARQVLTLQRQAGNQAISNLLQVQRCGGKACTDCGTGPTEEAGKPRQVVTAGADEFAEPGQQPVIQRAAAWAAGPVHQVNNLANCIINNQAVGVTWPSINGTQFWAAATVLGAMNLPTITVTAVPAGGFDAVVTAVGANNGSYDETVLAAGPWRLQTTKAVVRGMHPTLNKCTGGGNSRYRAMGDPSDNAMFTANRRHENKHATDHQAAFNASVVPWDTRLTTAQAAGTVYHGLTDQAARTALWTAMGGTPDQIADAFMQGCQNAVIAYHGSPAGGPVGAPTNPWSNSDCTLSAAKYTNPS